MAVVLLFVGIMMLLTGLGVLRAVLYPPTGAPALKPFLEVIMSEDVFPPAPLPVKSSPVQAPEAVPGELLSIGDPILRVRLVDLNVPFRVLLRFVFKVSVAVVLVWILITIITALMTTLVFAILGPVVNNMFNSILSGIP